MYRSFEASPPGRVDSDAGMSAPKFQIRHAVARTCRRVSQDVNSAVTFQPKAQPWKAVLFHRDWLSLIHATWPPLSEAVRSKAERRGMMEPPSPRTLAFCSVAKPALTFCLSHSSPTGVWSKPAGESMRPLVCRAVWRQAMGSSRQHTLQSIEGRKLILLVSHAGIVLSPLIPSAAM